MPPRCPIPRKPAIISRACWLSSLVPGFLVLVYTWLSRYHLTGLVKCEKKKHRKQNRVEKNIRGRASSFSIDTIAIGSQVVENDLVTARQADRSLGSQDFSRSWALELPFCMILLALRILILVLLNLLSLSSPCRWLTMGRLISASFGETSLSLEHWQMVKELERLRMDRLKWNMPFDACTQTCKTNGILVVNTSPACGCKTMTSQYIAQF